jgi:hypothetical protein
MFRQGIEDTARIGTPTPPCIGQLLTVSEFVSYLNGYNFGAVVPDRIVLHHTQVPTLAQWRGRSSMLSMQGFYRGKGWKAAPHFYVAPEGIWLFNPMNLVGIHANDGNANLEFQAKWDYRRLRWYSLGLEMVGNYDRVRPSGPVWENTRAVLGAACRRIGKSPESGIFFHRDFKTTKSCPGWAVTKPWVWSEVNTWLASSKMGLPYYVEVTAGDGLNIRQGAHTKYPIAGSLRKGERVLVDATKDEGQGTWLHLADHRGFISAAYTRRVV